MKYQKLVLTFLCMIHTFFCTIKASSYQEALDNLKRDGSNYWFYPSTEQAKKNSLIKVLEFYESMPTQSKQINDWIKYHSQLADSNYCFNAYRTKAIEDLKFINIMIHDIDKNDTKKTMLHLYQLQQHIQDSLSATEYEYQQESKKIKQDRLDNLQAQKIQEEIDNNRKITRAHESQAIEQRNLRMAQENEAEQLRQLTIFLRTLNFYHLHSESKQSLENIGYSIKTCTSKHLDMSQEKKEIFMQLTQLITLIKQAEKYKKLEEENKQLKESIARDQKEINEAQIIINEILDRKERLHLIMPTTSDRKKLEDENQKLKKRSNELHQAKECNTSLIDAILNDTAQSTTHKNQRQHVITQAQKAAESDNCGDLPVAYVIDDNYHGVIAEAIPIIENQEPQRLPKR